MSQKRKIFLSVFVVAALAAKIVAEFTHEILGHGSLVLLFGGEITSIYISVLWPYDVSYIGWILPSDVTTAQLVLIYAGGILACMFASFVTQTFLLLKKKVQWHYVVLFFWFAFWTLVNSTGYLIIGGLSPFGDVNELIVLGVLTKFLSFALGLIFFSIGFIGLSWILRKTLLEVFSAERASLGVILFWLILPALVMVMLANPERNLQASYIPLTFIPTVLSLFIEYFLVLSKQKANKNPDNITKK
ncbi:hypothetical protein HXY32_00920 [Candidatus Bathyarchaeota archaeon]|nr:hypothetical protein [Candidatus Bathyarchaeota archaeon]